MSSTRRLDLLPLFLSILVQHQIPEVQVRSIRNPSQVRYSQPSRVQAPSRVTSNFPSSQSNRSERREGLGPVHQRSPKGNNVNERESLFVQSKEERGPDHVETELGIVDFERADGVFTGGEVNA